MNNTSVEERCLQNIKQLGFRYKSTWSSRCNQQPLQDILDSQYNEYITKTRLYIFLFDKNVEGFADLANSLSKHSPRFFQHLCVCISSFLRLHISSDVWSHILITQIPLTLRTIAVAGPQQCAPEVFLRVPKNITNAHTGGLLRLASLCLSQCSLLSCSSAVYWMCAVVVQNVE